MAKDDINSEVGHGAHNGAAGRDGTHGKRYNQPRLAKSSHDKREYSAGAGDKERAPDKDRDRERDTDKNRDMGRASSRRDGAQQHQKKPSRPQKYAGSTDGETERYSRGKGRPYHQKEKYPSRPVSNGDTAGQTEIGVKPEAPGGAKDNAKDVVRENVNSRYQYPAKPQNDRSGAREHDRAPKISHSGGKHSDSAGHIRTSDASGRTKGNNTAASYGGPVKTSAAGAGITDGRVSIAANAGSDAGAGIVPGVGSGTVASTGAQSHGRRHGHSSPDTASVSAMTARIKAEETLDDIKNDIVRIEKEVALEIKEIENLKLTL